MTNKTNQKIYIGFQVLLFLGMVFFTISYFCKWNFNFLVVNSVDNIFNFSVYFLLSFLPYIVKKLNFEFTDFLVYYYFVAIGFHFIGGRAFLLYNTLYFSFVIHLANCFLIGIIIYGMIKNNTTNQGKLFMFIITIACVALVGVLWEVFEFLADNLFEKNMQRTIDPNNVPYIGKRAILDTMIDLLMDTLGGVCAGLVAGLKIKNKEIYTQFKLRRCKDIVETQTIKETIQEDKESNLKDKKENELSTEELKEW